MARIAVVDRSALDDLLTLAPERYGAADGEHGALVESIASICSETVRPGRGSYVVVDTTHAADGFIAMRPLSVTPQLRSSKKRLRPGDVIVSRLRPYLRQIGFVDDALAQRFPGAVLCCSTEFYVLRSPGARSIAFVAPALLTAAVQAALARAQEGGHHPRVPRQVLAALRVSDAVLSDRDAASEKFLASVRALRDAERLRDELIHQADTSA